MQQDNSAQPGTNVPQLPRRAAVAELTKNYPVAIHRGLKKAKIFDGTLDEKTGQRLVRDFLPGEMRAAAVATVADFAIGLLGIRIEIEFNAGIECDNLLRFYSHAKNRAMNYRKDNLGVAVVAAPEVLQELSSFEQTVAQHVFALMRNDFKVQPDLKEVDFWADIFRGMADAELTDVVGEAVRLVFLDHCEDFEAAHTADVLAQAIGVTRQ